MYGMSPPASPQHALRLSSSDLGQLGEARLVEHGGAKKTHVENKDLEHPKILKDYPLVMSTVCY